MPCDPARTALERSCRSSPRRRGPSAPARASVGEAQHNGVAQQPVGLAVGCDHEANELVGSSSSATGGVRDALALLGAQPECGFAGVADVSVAVLAAEQERLGTPAVAGATSEHDDSPLTAVLVLFPRLPAPAAAIRGVDA